MVDTVSFKKNPQPSCLFSKFCYRKGQPEKKNVVYVDAFQTKCVSSVPLESACRSAYKQFVIMEYSGVCYNEHVLSIKPGCYNGHVLSIKSGCYNERVARAWHNVSRQSPKGVRTLTPLLPALCDFLMIFITETLFIFSLGKTVHVFHALKIVYAFIMESSIIVFTKERLFIFFIFTCAVYIKVK